ncbi:hypothetical protein OF122_17405 [Pelagibacterium flavum]|uniref:Uncharacterized protein n=1 Tax=Pelagibacterium flavum TaxID=2984530 RepID=A0ABY6IR73_9HYPH|nr:hypothetical protein [Pelagibacterium sp. YIM 151497]UYQ71797.1 hypothetical protein OF122_17405 [Pelagibacterium sp. YIM 151497]
MGVDGSSPAERLFGFPALFETFNDALGLAGGTGLGLTLIADILLMVGAQAVATVNVIGIVEFVG